MSGLIVFSKPGCTPCKAVKNKLANAEIEFTEVDITKDSEARELLVTNGFMGTPVVQYPDGTLHNGVTGAIEYIRANKGAE